MNKVQWINPSSVFLDVATTLRGCKWENLQSAALSYLFLGFFRFSFACNCLLFGNTKCSHSNPGYDKTYLINLSLDLSCSYKHAWQDKQCSYCHNHFTQLKSGIQFISTRMCQTRAMMMSLKTFTLSRKFGHSFLRFIYTTTVCLERNLLERNLLLCLSSRKEEERWISILVRLLGMVLWLVREGVGGLAEW